MTGTSQCKGDKAKQANTESGTAISALLSQRKGQKSLSEAPGRLLKHPSAGCTYTKGNCLRQGGWVLALSLGGAECGLTFPAKDFLRTPLQCAGTRKLFNCLNDFTAFQSLSESLILTTSLIKRPWNSESHLHQSDLSHSC